MELEINDLKKYKHIHLIGIGGISMSAIAETLKNWNFKVTGSDLSQSKITDNLNDHGIKTTIHPVLPFLQRLLQNAIIQAYIIITIATIRTVPPRQRIS